MISQLSIDAVALKEFPPVALKRRRSAALVALFLFVGLNLALKIAIGRRPDSDGAMYTVKQFLSLHQPPDTVFMGSSLAKHIYWSLDANARQRSASLAYNLQRVSDSYLLIDQLFSDRYKPKRVVLLVGPRDFFDNDTPDIYRSATFKHVLSDGAFIRVLPLYASSVNDLTYISFERLSPMFSSRIGAQEATKAWLGHLGKAAGFEPSEPRPPATREEAWKRSLAEYNWRYQGISIERMSPQITFFRRILDLCKQNNVQTVVVDVPLSRANQNLLPAGFYLDFHAMLRKECLEHSGKFVDAAETLKLTDEDFIDSAHVTPHGGESINALIAQQMCSLQ